MKIKEMLTNDELKECTHWETIVCVDDLECMLARHYPEMEVKDFILFRILMELENINAREDERDE